jgi:hypothetical protein
MSDKIIIIKSNHSVHPVALEVNNNLGYLKGAFSAEFADITLNETPQEISNNNSSKKKSKKQTSSNVQQHSQIYKSTQNNTNDRSNSSGMGFEDSDKEHNDTNNHSSNNELPSANETPEEDEPEENNPKKIKVANRILHYWKKYPQICTMVNITQEDAEDIEIFTLNELKKMLAKILKYKNASVLASKLNHYVDDGEKLLNLFNASISGISKTVMGSPEIHQILYDMANDKEEISHEDAEDTILPADPQTRLLKSIFSTIITVVNSNANSDKVINTLTNNNIPHQQISQTVNQIQSLPPISNNSIISKYNHLENIFNGND